MLPHIGPYRVAHYSHTLDNPFRPFVMTAGGVDSKPGAVGVADQTFVDTDRTYPVGLVVVGTVVEPVVVAVGAGHIRHSIPFFHHGRVLKLMVRRSMAHRRRGVIILGNSCFKLRLSFRSI